MSNSSKTDGSIRQANKAADKIEAEENVVKRLRKRSADLSKKIEKLTKERSKVEEEMNTLENACPHVWSEPRPMKSDPNRYEKECKNCGKVMRSKDVKIQF